MELRATHRELPHPDRVIVHRKGVPGSEEEEHLARELRCFPNTAQASMAIPLGADVLPARASVASPLGTKPAPGGCCWLLAVPLRGCLGRT